MANSLLFLLGSASMLSTWGLLISEDNAPASGDDQEWRLPRKQARKSAPPVCIVSDGAIPAEFQCDGTIDCPDGSDETLAACKDAPMETFFDDQYWMLHPPGYKAPNPEHYKPFYDLYAPRLADLPFAGKSVASVEVYLIDSPAFHDTRQYHGVQRWLLLQFTKFLDFLHFGVGFLYRDANGKELGRIAMQYWTGYTEVLENPNVLPDDNKMHFDEQGRLYFDTRAVTTFRKSRGSWEGGYWERELLVKTLDAEAYNTRLKWLNEWLPDHMQFLSFGYFFRDDKVLQPRTSCVEFARFFITAMTDVDIWKLDFEWVRVAMTGMEIDVLAKDLDAREVSKFMEKHNYTLASNRCANCQDPNVVVLAPAAYNPDGTPDDQHSDHYGRVHVLKPTPNFRNDHEPSSGRLLQNRRNRIAFAFVVASATVAAIYGVLKCWCSSDNKQPKKA